MRQARGCVAVVLALTLFGSACGSSRDSEPKSDAAAPTSTAASGTATKFGTLESPCGEGDAKGATDQGITDDAVKIGFGDDAGYSGVPGLDHEISDAMRGMIAWCNDQGGINGRKVEGTYYDAKITEAVNVMTEACAKEFFLVGQLFSLDAAAEPKRRECGLPTVSGTQVSPLTTNGPQSFQPLPNPLDFIGTSDAYQLKKLFPEEIKHSAALYANYPAVIVNMDKIIPALKALGYGFSCDQTYNIAGEADYKPFIQKLKGCGIQLVRFAGSPYPVMENLLEAAAQLDYHPIWVADPNAYDEAFAKWNGSGFADKVYFKLNTAPLFEASSNSAAQAFLDIVNNSGGDASGLGQYGASAFLLWATATKSCGTDVTRDCVVKALEGIHDWDAGGLQASADVGANRGTECGMLVKLTGTKFERVVPKKVNTYDCDPSYLQKVTGKVLTDYKMDANRITQP